MTRAKIRCAIYTRKSTEDGLEQAFNSLDAQREACSAFITSQRSEGWVEVPDRFDDGGVSGGTLERPALKALFAAIEAGRIDMVVVYKVDRLTRSLADFGKMVERFDAKGVSFVSVTQAFNTSTSMGRLTLNMLLSFAQFEREVTAERIRDKILASRKKGMWTGGNPPLGYDVQDKTLVINEEEARLVRTLFGLYREHRSVPELVLIANERGYRTKRTRNGRGGIPFGLGTLYALLSNPIHAGMIRAGTGIVDGQHEAIIDPEEWQEVQAILTANRGWTGRAARATAPLTGKLFADGIPLTPHHAKKTGFRYRYYVSRTLVRKGRGKKTGWRLPGGEVERAVLDVLLDHLGAPADLALRWLGSSATATMIEAVVTGIDALRDRLRGTDAADALFSLGDVLQRIDLDDTRLSLTIGETALAKLVGCTALTVTDPLTIERPLALKRRGHERKLVLGIIEQDPSPDADWTALFSMVLTWKDKIFDEGADLQSLAKSDGIDRGNAARLLPLAFFDPTIIIALCEGQGPVDLTVPALRALMAEPLSWSEQRDRIGL